MVAMSVADIGQHADVVIVLGGDGTMLGVARQLAAFKVPMIGINQGRLGFMTDIPIERMISDLTDMLTLSRRTPQRSPLAIRSTVTAASMICPERAQRPEIRAGHVCNPD